MFQNQHHLKPPPETNTSSTFTSDVVGLKEVKLVVEDFSEEYGGDWSTLKSEVESIGRTEEEEEKDEDGCYTTATAKVHTFWLCRTK